MTDLATGLYAHGAILAALLQRQQTGIGQKIDVNLLSTQVACLINVASNYLNAGKEAKRWGTAHESIVRKLLAFDLLHSSQLHNIFHAQHTRHFQRKLVI